MTTHIAEYYERSFSTKKRSFLFCQINCKPANTETTKQPNTSQTFINWKKVYHMAIFDIQYYSNFSVWLDFTVFQQFSNKYSTTAHNVRLAHSKIIIKNQNDQQKIKSQQKSVLVNSFFFLWLGGKFLKCGASSRLWSEFLLQVFFSYKFFRFLKFKLFALICNLLTTLFKLLSLD